MAVSVYCLAKLRMSVIDFALRANGLVPCYLPFQYGSGDLSILSPQTKSKAILSRTSLDSWRSRLIDAAAWSMAATLGCWGFLTLCVIMLGFMI